jgi:uncharacterized protein DUF4386
MISSPQVYARVGGALYLILIAVGIFAEAFVMQSNLIVSANAAATAHNIMTHESLWRIAWVGEMIMSVCAVALAMIFYVLLRPVNRSIALLAAFFNLVSIAMEFGIKGISHFAVLLLLGGADYLKAFDQHQLQALALLTLKLRDYGYGISLVFFAFFLLLLGYLIFRSGYLPKILGVLLTIGSLCYLTNSLVLFLAPKYAAMIFPILIPGGVSELALSLWLIVKGVNVPKWEEKAGRLASSGA